ncbi:MAG TPA: hypothetical protein VGO47_05345 [Chlamydiales bacterium]|nr:hypothetical protein [Chlamydiales bacterium]
MYSKPNHMLVSISKASQLASGMLPGARVVVVGSRSFPYPGFVRNVVTCLSSGITVCSGGGGVVDVTAVEQARKLGLSVAEYPAQWLQLGKRAGVIRSLAMLQSGVTAVFVFVSDVSCVSPGSLATIHIAQRLGLPVYVVSA